MQVDVLGPVRLTSDHGRAFRLMTKERALLAALALRTGHTVPTGDLEEALWGEDRPRTAARSLQAHVARLRGCLGADALVTSSGGYRLALPTSAVDVARLEQLVGAANDAASDKGARAARRRYSEAEALWRGEPLTDLADTPERTEQVARLRELWQQARDGRIRADLELGRQVQVLAELQHLVTDEPLREPLWIMLILALYRAGRQIEALQTYQRVQRLLADEWGVDPSPELQRLQWQILRQDPQLDRSPPPPPLVMPEPLSSFVGRTGQVANVEAALAESRLVTLHGPAGVGKSRLAQEVARDIRQRFSDGVWWVDLTVATDAESALRRTAETLRLSSGQTSPLEEALAAYLQHRNLLMVLDNCEHVVDPLARTVLGLLQRASELRVLATSRAYLNVTGEARWEVPPLSLPEPGWDEAAIVGSDAVALFQQRRGRRVDDPGVNTLGDVAALCRQLDGLPLAVELAAAQAQQQTVRELLDRWTVESLTTPAAKSAVARTPHHATVAGAIEWSYSDLDPICRRTFDWVSVFPGDFDAQAAAAVAAAIPGVVQRDAGSYLRRLVDGSLVEARPVDGATRYRLLFVMREFAAARLTERGETDAAWQAFAGHYRALAVRAGPEMNGRRPGVWLQRITRELTNLRAAVDWALENESAEFTLGFVRAMGRVVWAVPPGVGEDLARLGEVVERADAEGADADALAWAWQELVTSAYLSGDVEFALKACDWAEELFDKVGDRAGLATVCHHRGATHLLATGDLAEAGRLFREGRVLGRESGAVVPEAWCCAHLGQLQCLAHTVTDETSYVLRRAENLADPEDSQLQSHLLMDTALLHLARGELDAGVEAAQRCERYSHQVGNASIEQAAMVVGATALLRQGCVDAARSMLLRAAQIALDMGNSVQLGLALQALAQVVDRDENPIRAARLWGAGRGRTPVWPLLEPIYDPSRSRDVLGDQFDDETAFGATLTAKQALGLAIA